jgi:hypothetical protein
MGTYVEVIEAVQRDALDSMGALFRTLWRRFGAPAVVNIVVKRGRIDC